MACCDSELSTSRCRYHSSCLQDPEAVPQNGRANIPKRQDERYKLQSLLQHRPIKVRRSELANIKASMTEGEVRCVLDLRAFMQLHPWTLPVDAPLSHAYRILRTMGLRHLYVTPPKPTIVGIVTRKDLTEEAASLKIGEVLRTEGTSLNAGMLRTGGTYMHICEPPLHLCACRQHAGITFIHMSLHQSTSSDHCNLSVHLRAVV